MRDSKDIPARTRYADAKMPRFLLRPSPRIRSLLAPGSLVFLAGCSGLNALTTEESARLRVFDHYWQALSDQYPLFGRKHVRWPEIGRQYRAAVPFARRPSEFYHLLAGLLSELGDIHVSLRVPRERMKENGIAATSLLDTAGFKLMPIGGRPHVVGWPVGGAPAHPLGLPEESKYPEILRIGGFPVVLSLAPVLLLGPPGSSVELHLRWRDGRVTRHLLRRPPSGTKESASALGHLARRGISWAQHKTEPFPMLEVSTLNRRLSIESLDKALSAHASAPGLILDLRRNLGGSFDLTRQFAGRFLSDSVEVVRVIGKQSAWGGLVTIDPFVRITWMPRAPRFEPPVVVLTSSLTGSAAEHLARTLQRHAGATVIGESTAGAEAGVIHVEGEEGSRLTFSGIRILDRTGHGLEGQGVIPDRSVPLSLDHVERLGPDAAVDDWRQRLLDTAADVLR